MRAFLPRLVPILAGAVDLALCLTDDSASIALPVALVAVSATLYARHRRPMAVLAVHLVWILCALHWWHAGPLAGPLVALYAVAVRRPLRLSLGCLALTTAALGVQLNVWHQDPFTWAAAILVPGGAWALGYLAVRLRLDLIRNERLRIARDLHDIVSHSLSGIVIQAAGAQAVLPYDPDRTSAALTAIQAAGADAMDDMHHMLGLLRSDDRDDAHRLDRQPGLENIGTLLDWARDKGLKPRTVVDGEPVRLADRTNQTAYRIVQEAFTNTLKHEGPQADVTLRLCWSPTDLTISVENHSDHPTLPGAPAWPGGGYGLTGLRERVATVGGTFQSQVLDQGFLVSARLPLTRPGKEPMR